MELAYRFEKFVDKGRLWMYSNEPFDRKTFDPENNKQHSRTLGRLRAPGGRRFFLHGWGKWLKTNEKSHLTRSAALNGLRDWSFTAKVVVDAGCGNSADADLICEGGGEGLGYDLFPREQSHQFPQTYVAKSFTHTRKSKFVIQDICERWPNEDGSVDIVLSSAVVDLMNENDRTAFYYEVWRVLKPGGILSLYGIKLKNGHGFDDYKEKAKLKMFGFQVENNHSVILAYKPI